MLQSSLQQQEVLVTLSLLTANPQLVVFRLGQPAMDLQSALQLSCRDEFCYRLVAAGVPFEPSNIILEPDYGALFGRVNNGQVTSGDDELARRRRIAGIAGGAAAGGFVFLLLLLIIYKRRASCCAGRRQTKAAANKMHADDKHYDMQKEGLPVKAPGFVSNNVTNNITAGELGGGGCSGSCSSRSISRVGASMPRSRLIKHAVFDHSSLTNGCSSGYVTTHSNYASPAAAANANAAAAAAPVAVHSVAAVAVTLQWPNPAAGMQQQQQRQLADVHFHADSFKEWVASAAASTVVNVDAAAASSSSSSSSSNNSRSHPADDSRPCTPDSAAIDLAAVLPASPISQPLYFSHPGLTYAKGVGSSRGASSSSSALAARQQQQQQQDEAAVKRLSIDQFKLLLGRSPDGSSGSTGQAVQAGSTGAADLAVHAVHVLPAGSTCGDGKAVQGLHAAPGGSWPLLHHGSGSSTV
jgi:hypothetical protein